MRCAGCGKRLRFGGALYERLRRMHYRCIVLSAPVKATIMKEET